MRRCWRRPQPIGCQRCGSNSSIRLFMCVGSRVSTSLRYAHGSCPLSLADCTRLITTAARWPASSLPANSQAFRSCSASHERNKANFAFMRSRRHGATRRPCMRGRGCVVATSHNQSDCRNFIRALGGRYRAGLISGGFSRAKARSFIARSASTYMCVVDGLSWPSHSAISHGSAPD